MSIDPILSVESSEHFYVIGKGNIYVIETPEKNHPVHNLQYNDLVKIDGKYHRVNRLEIGRMRTGIVVKGS